MIMASLLAGCRGIGSGAADSGPLRRPEKLAQVDVSTLHLFNGLSGASMRWDGLVRAASEADVVFIGESHGHSIGLAAAARLWEQIAGTVPTAALSLECFDRDQQVALDDYLDGVVEDEAAFCIASSRNGSNYPPGLRAMVETARAKGQPVIAANAPRRYVYVSRVDGYDALRSLSAEQRRLFVIPDTLTGGRYRVKFFEMMDEYRGPENPDTPPLDVEGLFRSQNLGDATMADSILQAVAEGRRPVVHVVDQFHCDYSGGAVSRIADQRSDLLVWTISMVAEWSDVLREEDQGRADCVIYVGPGKEQD